MSQKQITVCFPTEPKFKMGDSVRKMGTKGQWHGFIVGVYTTECTNVGYAVESVFEKNSVQIYPENALEYWNKPCGCETGELDTCKTYRKHGVGCGSYIE